MRVYIAAPFTHRWHAEEAAKKFETAGHTITYKWWETNVDMHGDASSEIKQQIAIEEVAGVLKAEVFVLLNTSKSEGKAFETGVAFIGSIPIVVVGGPTHIFHFLPRVVFVPNLFHALTHVNGLPPAT